MEAKDKSLVSHGKEDRRKHFFRKPTRRWWAMLGSAGSFAMLYSGPVSPSGPGAGGAYFQHFGLPEGFGPLCGSVAELLPEEQTTPAGIPRT